jgi:hypothetical protein
MEVSGQSHAPAALYPRGMDPPVTIGYEAGWASEQVWTQRLEEKSFASVDHRIPSSSLLTGISDLQNVTDLLLFSNYT